jgi:hypothetical protein
LSIPQRWKFQVSISSSLVTPKALNNDQLQIYWLDF